MAVLIIFPVILQTVINLIMLSIEGQGDQSCETGICNKYYDNDEMTCSKVEKVTSTVLIPDTF